MKIKYVIVNESRVVSILSDQCIFNLQLTHSTLQCFFNKVINELDESDD